MQNQMQLKILSLKKIKYIHFIQHLEPCSHIGREESCVSKILKSKKNRVIFFSVNDPDKRVNGNGKKILIKNKLEVRSGILVKKTKDLYHGYFLNRIKSRPKILLKLAITSDNFITVKKNKRTKITNLMSDSYTDILRSEVDAILVGSNTVRVDDCILKCKMPGLVKKITCSCDS